MHLDHDLSCQQEYEELLRDQEGGAKMLGTVILVLCVVAIVAVFA